MSKYFIHVSSYLDPNVSVGDNTKIWHFNHILEGTTIGKNCSFGQNCVIGPKVRIGNNVKVQNNVSIYQGVEIEDDVFLGPSMVFTNVINPRSFINRKNEFKRTLVKRGSSLGANCTIICGITIGEFSMIGSGSVVTKNTKPFGLYYGNPARLHGWVTKHGNKMNFEEDNTFVDPQDGSQYFKEKENIIVLNQIDK